MADIKKIYADYLGDTTRGGVPATSVTHKFGRNNAVGTSEVDIRAESGVFDWPTSGQPLEAISGSAADDAGGTGARVVTVEGLLAGTWELAEADITMNGASASTATDSAFIRVNRAWVKEGGTYSNTTSGNNAGQITIRFSGVGSQTMTIIASGNPAPGQTQQTHFTVPASTTAVIKAVTANVDSAKVANISAWKREEADTIAAPFTSRRNLFILNGVSGVNQLPINYPLGPFPAKTDLWFSAIAGAAGTAVEVDYEIELKDTGSGGA